MQYLDVMCECCDWTFRLTDDRIGWQVDDIIDVICPVCGEPTPCRIVQITVTEDACDWYFD